MPILLRQVVAEYLMAVDRSHGVLEGTPAVPAGQGPVRPRAQRERGAVRPSEAMQQAVQLYNAGNDIHAIARQLVQPRPCALGSWHAAEHAKVLP